MADLDEAKAELAKREAAHQESWRNSQLGGATEAWSIDDRSIMRLLVMQLMTCTEHGGVHHFAVTGEGKTLWCSPSGIDCINNANLGFRIPTAEERS